MEGARLPSPSTDYTAAPPASLPALTEGAAASITRRLAVGSAKPLTRPKGEASPEPMTMTTGALQSGHMFGPWPPRPRPSSHVSMQAVWYRCPHGSVVAFSPSAKAHKQIAQSSPVSPAPQLAVGSAATTVDSSSSVAPPPPPPPLPPPPPPPAPPLVPPPAARRRLRSQRLARSAIIAKTTRQERSVTILEPPNRSAIVGSQHALADASGRGPAGGGGGLARQASLGARSNLNASVTQSAVGKIGCVGWWRTDVR